MPSISPEALEADTDTDVPALSFAFDNSYARLPERFHVALPPQPVAQPRLIRLNHALAEELGLDADALDTSEGAAIFAGNRIPEGAEPLAMAYAGHQFGHYTPQLGDGRGDPARGSDRQTGASSRHPAQGFRAHALLAHG